MVRVLVTGASGVVGTILRHHWGQPQETNPPYVLRLADLTQPADLQPHEEFVLFDLTDAADCARVVAGVDTVVHLAADAGSAEEDFVGSLLPRNLLGPYLLLEAAAAARSVQRVVLASSIYAVRGHAESALPVATDQPPHPMGLYGASKYWAEALGRVFAEGTARTPGVASRSGSSSENLSVIAVRLGNPRMEQGSAAWSTEDATYILTPRDCASLFRRCVDVPKASIPPFLIVHGSSEHRHQFMDIEATKSWLGWAPQDGTAYPRQATGDLTFNGRM